MLAARLLIINYLTPAAPHITYVTEYLMQVGMKCADASRA
jgi:hypothetical protein